MIMILKILLTGKNGQVGAELARQLPRLGGVLALDREQLDLTKPKVIQRAIRETKPRIIVNAAAYTAVDKAEEEESIARTVNAEAPGVMAEEAKKIGALLVHYSTDYVFNGTKTTPYTEEDPPNPISAYGRTKFAGEQAIRASGVPHLIFRTAWIYATRGRNFLLTILRLATQREELRIVHDQIGAPSWGREIARATTEVLEQVTQQGNLEQGPSLRGGIYHMTAAGMTNWYDFALAILEEAALVPPDVPWFEAATGGKPLIARRIVPISTQEYPTPAHRPQYSVLSNSRLVRDFGIELPHWRSQLRSAVTLDGVSNNIQ
jgi:dTDP-4-dehydrorhamnose reductase